MGVRATFIRNMKFYRKQAGLTQEKLAERIGMSTSYIGDMEARERFPSAETIDKIAEALGIRSAVLFDETGSPDGLASAYKAQFGHTLSEELKARLISAVDDVCRGL